MSRGRIDPRFDRENGKELGAEEGREYLEDAPAALARWGAERCRTLRGIARRAARFVLADAAWNPQRRSGFEDGFLLAIDDGRWYDSWSRPHLNVVDRRGHHLHPRWDQAGTGFEFVELVCRTLMRVGAVLGLRVCVVAAPPSADAAWKIYDVKTFRQVVLARDAFQAATFFLRYERGDWQPAEGPPLELASDAELAKQEDDFRRARWGITPRAEVTRP